MNFKTGDVVKYKNYDPITMIYHKNFAIDQIFLDPQGNIILIKSKNYLLNDKTSLVLNRKVISVNDIELDLDYLRAKKIDKIKNVN